MGVTPQGDQKDGYAINTLPPLNCGGLNAQLAHGPLDQGKKGRGTMIIALYLWTALGLLCVIDSDGGPRSKL